jgi:hypothetical protein
LPNDRLLDHLLAQRRVAVERLRLRQRRANYDKETRGQGDKEIAQAKI